MNQLLSSETFDLQDFFSVNVVSHARNGKLI
jgi:hypothetical protein